MAELKTFVRRKSVEAMFPGLSVSAIDNLLNHPDFPRRVYATGTRTPFWVLEQLKEYQERVIATGEGGQP